MSAKKTKPEPAPLPKGERTKALILEGALEMFRKRGVDQTSMRDIAAEAGLALGAAYYYFPSKEAIVLAYFQRRQVTHSVRARAKMAEAASTAGRVAAVMHTKLDVLKKDRKLLGALFRNVGDPSDPLSVFGEETRAVRAESVGLFDEALAPAGLDDATRAIVAQALWVLHMGVLLYFLYDKSPGQKKTRALVDAAASQGMQLGALAPMLGTVIRQVSPMLAEAGLLPANGSARSSSRTTQ